jgi:ATP/maltotriose-dependent transcriptional regulator MalT
LMLSERWGQSDNDVACLDYLGRALTFGNDWVQARQVFQRANNAARNISPWFWQMNVNFTLESMLDLDTLDAREFAEQIRRVQESGSQYSDLLKARLFLRQNQPENALEVLEEALTRLAGQPSFDIVRIHALRSLALRMMGDEKQSLVSIRQALELAEPENRIATFVREGLQMEKLLQLARLRSITPKFVNRLLAAFESRRLLTPKLAPGPETLIEPLSERELEILTYLNGPFSTPEIAGQLIVSANTVRTHIKNIYNKLGVHGRSGAVKQARELGLLN